MQRCQVDLCRPEKIILTTFYWPLPPFIGLTPFIGPLIVDVIRGVQFVNGLKEEAA